MIEKNKRDWLKSEKNDLKSNYRMRNSEKAPFLYRRKCSSKRKMRHRLFNTRNQLCHKYNQLYSGVKKESF